MSTLELKLDRNHFFNAVAKTQGVVDRKSTTNTLSHVLIESLPEGRVRLVGTDYDVTIEAEVPAETIVEGAACINGRSLFDVLKNIDDQHAVHLETLDNHWAELTAGRARFKLAGVPPSDFPDTSLPEGVAWIGLPKALFKDLVDKTSFSMSDDETRMNINGVYFELSPGSSEGLTQLSMVSTDGHRLSKVEAEAELQGFDGTERQAIIHRKGVQELRRILDGDSELMEIGFAAKVILFRADDSTFTVRQIDDTYPDYGRVIPSGTGIRVVAPREPLMRAIRRNAVLTSNKTHIIKLEIEPGAVAVTTSNPEYGEGRDEIDAEYDGDGLVVGFNYTYLLDVLGALRGDRVVLEMNDEFSPTVVTSPSEPGALFVIMPMRV